MDLGLCVCQGNTSFCNNPQIFSVSTYYVRILYLTGK